MSNNVILILAKKSAPDTDFGNSLPVLLIIIIVILACIYCFFGDKIKKSIRDHRIKHTIDKLRKVAGFDKKREKFNKKIEKYKQNSPKLHIEEQILSDMHNVFAPEYRKILKLSDRIISELGVIDKQQDDQIYKTSKKLEMIVHEYNSRLKYAQDHEHGSLFSELKTKTMAHFLHQSEHCIKHTIFCKKITLYRQNVNIIATV